MDGFQTKFIEVFDQMSLISYNRAGLSGLSFVDETADFDQCLANLKCTFFRAHLCIQLLQERLYTEARSGL